MDNVVQEKTRKIVELEHIFYSIGDAEKISWAIKTDDMLEVQTRDHIKMYKNKITDTQSKYVALHVGLFWAIGVFTIKNGDKITIKLEDETMIMNFKSKSNTDDEFIKNRTRFINQLIIQRKLAVSFELIEPKENLARK